jgi:hypothetical protein
VQVLQGAVLVAASALGFQFNAALAGIAALCASQLQAVFRPLEERPVKDALITSVETVLSFTSTVFQPVGMGLRALLALFVVINISVIKAAIAGSVTRDALFRVRAIRRVSVVAFCLADAFRARNRHKVLKRKFLCIMVPAHRAVVFVSFGAGLAWVVASQLRDHHFLSLVLDVLHVFITVGVQIEPISREPITVNVRLVIRWINNVLHHNHDL